MRNVVIALIVIVILVGGFIFLSNRADAPIAQMPQNNENSAGGTFEEGSPDANESDTPSGSDAGMLDDGVSVDGSVTVGSPVVVTYTENGFSPASVTVKKGQAVRFVNNSDGEETWPASAMHPTHAVYPEKKATDCLGSSFDACKAIGTGESWEFTFTQVGTWRYHDHLHASKTGTVVVTE